MRVRKIKLTEKDREELVSAIRKIQGQLNSISEVIQSDGVTGDTFTQLLAVKGGANKICKEVISRGVVPDLKNYTLKEIDQALNIIFKLD